MKRKKRLTRRERKALEGGPGAGAPAPHIHCVACGRHVDPKEFTTSPIGARFLRCRHGGKFAACVPCVSAGQALLDEHDRTGQPVQPAAAWH